MLASQFAVLEQASDAMVVDPKLRPRAINKFVRNNRSLSVALSGRTGQ